MLNLVSIGQENVGVYAGRSSSLANAEGEDALRTAGKMPALREPHLHIRSLLQVNAFHEPDLAGAQRQNH
jgi:hypothetical protein